MLNSTDNLIGTYINGLQQIGNSGPESKLVNYSGNLTDGSLESEGNIISGNGGLFDRLGRRVQTLVNEPMQAGRHTITFEAGNLPSGLYFYRLETTFKVLTREIMLIK